MLDFDMPIRHMDLMDLMPEECPRAVSMALVRLTRNRFIFKRGKVGIIDSGERTQQQYALNPGASHAKKYRPLSSIERTRRHREKRRFIPLNLPVRSVFDLARKES